MRKGDLCRFAIDDANGADQQCDEFCFFMLVVFRVLSVVRQNRALIGRVSLSDTGLEKSVDSAFAFD